MGDSSDSRSHVGLFVTCLVDLMRPSVGFAAVKLIEDAGCRVSVPAAQTCCGQYSTLAIAQMLGKSHDKPLGICGL